MLPLLTALLLLMLLLCCRCPFNSCLTYIYSHTHTHTRAGTDSLWGRGKERHLHTLAHMCVCELNRHLCNFSAAAAWLHMLSVPFRAVCLFLPPHLTASSCLRQRIFYIFFCAPRRQGYKNCLVLKAFYATLCAQSTVTAAATAAAASACLARCCYGAASLRLTLSLCLLILPPYSVSALSLLLPHQHLRLYLIFLLAHASHTLFVLSTSLPLPASPSLSLCFSACILLLLFFALFSVLLASFFGKIQLLLFCFLLCVFAFCLLPSAYVRTCVCVFDFEHFLWLFFVFVCCFLYIFHCAVFCFVLLVAFNARCAFCRIFNAGMWFSIRPPFPSSFTFIFSVIHSSRCLSIEFAVSLFVCVCMYLYFTVCVFYFLHFFLFLFLI